MSTDETLMHLFRELRARAESPGLPTRREAALRARLAATKDLFEKLEVWLHPAKQEGLVRVERQTFVHVDDGLGTLDESLRLVVGRHEVFFAPRGGNLGDASAQVDMIVGQRRVVIVLLPERGWHLRGEASLDAKATRGEPLTDASFVAALRHLFASQLVGVD